MPATLIEETEAPLLREAAQTGYRALMGEVAQLMGPDIEAHGSPVLKAIFAEYFRQFPPFEGAEQLKAMAQRTHYARAWSLFLERYPLVLTPFLPHPFFAPNRDAEGPEGVRDALGGAYYSFAMNFLGLPAGNLPAHLADLPQRTAADRCADRRAALARGSDRRCHGGQSRRGWGGSPSSSGSAWHRSDEHHASGS